MASFRNKRYIYKTIYNTKTLYPYVYKSFSSNSQRNTYLSIFHSKLYQSTRQSSLKSPYKSTLNLNSQNLNSFLFVPVSCSKTTLIMLIMHYIIYKDDNKIHAIHNSLC